MKQQLFKLWNCLAPGKRKLALWTAGVLLFYTIFGFLILPLIVKWVAVKQISELLGREASIRQVRINPYVLSGTIRGLLIKDTDGQPFLSCQEAYANFQLISFFGKPWVFKEVWAVEPYCRVQINPDYSFNFSDITKKLSQPPPRPKKPAEPLYLHIGKFQILNASASVTDLTLRLPFQRRVGPVQITLTDLHTDPNNENPYSFVGTTDSGERFSWTGQFSFEPLQSSGDLALEGLSIPKYAPLFQDLVRFDIKNGVVAGRAAYQFKLIGSNYLATVTNASCSLKSLKMTERSGAENVVELDQFAVSGVSADTEARRSEIAHVAVNGGRLAIRRNHDETINLVQWSEPAAGATNVPGGILFLLQAATNAFAAFIESTNLWSATVHEVEVTNCSVQWDDEATLSPVHLNVDEITLSARHLSNVAGSNQTTQLSVRWNTNGIARVRTELQLSPPAAEVALSVTNMDLSPLGPYAEPFLNLVLVDSKVGVEGNLQMSLGSNNVPEVTFRGDARLDDFSTVDAQTEELLKWKSVQVTGLEANLQPPTVAIKEIAVMEPSARVAFDTNQALNFLAVLKTPETNAAAAPSAPAAREAKPAEKKLTLNQKLGGILRQVLSSGAGSGLPKITVETISITNGFMQFNDRSVQPPVSASLQELNGTISGISSEELSQADLRLVTKAAGTGPIEITGKINPLSSNAPTRITIVFRDVDLTPASPYTAKFVGYRLRRGRLGLQADYDISQRQITAKNVVILDQFTLGERVESPDATKLPVKLAVALLKDRNGRIELELPIDGNLDDPNFHFGKVIVHVLANVMTKIVTSPFAALGALFGGKGEEVSYQDFAPGSAELETAHVQKLENLVNGLYERPGLELQIEGSFDPVADGEALRKQKLEQRFREQKWASLRKAEQARLSPDQVPLTSQEYASRLEVAYEEAMRSGSLSNAIGSARASTPSGPSLPVEVPGSSTTEKGATALLQKPAAFPNTTLDEKERLLLSTVRVTDDDLIQLATERARNTRQRIMDTGKIDAARLFVVDLGSNRPTNLASRVFFHLQ